MRIVSGKRIVEWAAAYPNAATTLLHWKKLVEGIQFANFAELRRYFPSADQVIVSSGNPVVVFNIKRQYRLIAAIHYNRGVVYTLRFLTHAEYDKDKWKEEL